MDKALDNPATIIYSSRLGPAGIGRVFLLIRNPRPAPAGGDGGSPLPAGLEARRFRWWERPRMARKNRKVELYEILSRRRAPGEQGAGEPVPYGPQQRPRTGREIVFSLDAAFLLFVAVLVLIGTAYYIGYQRGRDEQRRDFGPNAQDRPDGVADESEVDPTRVSLSVARRRVLRGIDTNRFTIRLRSLEPRSPSNLERLRLEAESLTEAAVTEGARVLLFEDEAGDRFSLGVGLFADRSEQGLRALQERLRAYATAGGVRPYRSAATAERAGDLGVAIE